MAFIQEKLIEHDNSQLGMFFRTSELKFPKEKKIVGDKWAQGNHDSKRIEANGLKFMGNMVDWNKGA
jgi:hypothetical protein